MKEIRVSFLFWVNVMAKLHRPLVDYCSIAAPFYPSHFWTWLHKNVSLYSDFSGFCCWSFFIYNSCRRYFSCSCGTWWCSMDCRVNSYHTHLFFLSFETSFIFFLPLNRKVDNVTSSHCSLIKYEQNKQVGLPVRCEWFVYDLY